MKCTFYVLKYVHYLYFLKSLKDETLLVFSLLGVEPPPADQRHKFEVGTSFVRTAGAEEWCRGRP